MLEKKKQKGEKAVAKDAKDPLAKAAGVEDEEELDILKLFDEDESPLNGELEEEGGGVAEPVDPEERKMSVRKLAELRMKAQQV